MGHYSHLHKGTPFPETAGTSTLYTPGSTIKALDHQRKLAEHSAEIQLLSILCYHDWLWAARHRVPYAASFLSRDQTFNQLRHAETEKLMQESDRILGFLTPT